MSTEELPILQQLKQGQEKESFESREKLRKSIGLEKSNGEKSSEKHENETDKATDVKVVIDEEKLHSKKPNIFAPRNEIENKCNIFANKKSVNLLNISKESQTNGGINIFTMAASSQPLIQNEPEDDLISNSSVGPESNSKEQVLPDPIQKVMKYDYGEKTERLGQFKILRFKNGPNATKEGVILSLEREKNSDSKIIFFMLRSEATRILIYEAFVLSNTKIQNFMNKPQNIKIGVIHCKKVEDKSVPEKEIVKLQFESEEEVKRFRELLGVRAETEQQCAKDQKKEE